MSQLLPPKSDPPQAVTIPPNPLPRLELLHQEIGDDEPTLKMLVPPHLLHESRRPDRNDQWQRTGPNWGLIIAVLFCLAFWGSLAYIVFR